MPRKIYLASTSPRRRELLEQIGVTFSLLEVSVDETPLTDESAETFAERMAREKAQAGWRKIDRQNRLPVLGADTVVVVDGRILGKPRDREDAIQMLRLLSGREHEVLTGVAVTDGTLHSCVSRTRVSFRETRADELDAYWNTGEPADKAGAYAIQGRAAVFIDRIDGSYSGVVGLPLYETATLLKHVGINLLEASG